MKKKWIISCLVFIAAIYLFYEYLFPHSIQENYMSTIYSIESKFEKQTFVTIKGKLHKNLIGKNTFIGEMIVDEDLNYEINLKDDGKKYFEILIAKDKDFFNIESIGSIMISNDFSKIWIQLDDINEQYNFIDGYIAGPARNMEEANDIARRILEGT